MRMRIMLLLACMAGFVVQGFCQVSSPPPPPPPKIPVIFDTDIGSDIDDTWALALLLCSPELDLRMVVTDSHDTKGRAQIVAKFLHDVTRSDIPVGIGTKTSDKQGPQFAWAKDYDLSKYPGTIHQDGVGAMIDFIHDATEKITLIVVGPCPNIQEMLRRAPDVVNKVRVIAMSGSVEKGYDGVHTPDAEYNVREDVLSARAMYTADWDLTIAPLDTAGLVTIRGAKYQDLLHAKNPVFVKLLENYRKWLEEGKINIPIDARSSTLFDCVAVYLAFDQSLCEMKSLPVKVDNLGYTVVSPGAKIIHVAMNWTDLGKFEDLLVERIKKGMPLSPMEVEAAAAAAAAAKKR